MKRKKKDEVICSGQPMMMHFVSIYLYILYIYAISPIYLRPIYRSFFLSIYLQTSCKKWLPKQCIRLQTYLWHVSVSRAQQNKVGEQEQHPLDSASPPDNKSTQKKWSWIKLINLGEKNLQSLKKMSRQRFVALIMTRETVT